jgi:hypothetical protein
MWPPYIARRYLFLLSPPGKTVAVRQVRASVLERVRTAWVGQVALGFLRLRSGQALRLRAPSAVSCDQSVRRFAQDDDFVGVLKKRSRRLALMGRSPGYIPKTRICLPGLP